MAGKRARVAAATPSVGARATWRPGWWRAWALASTLALVPATGLPVLPREARPEPAPVRTTRATVPLVAASAPQLAAIDGPRADVSPGRAPAAAAADLAVLGDDLPETRSGAAMAPAAVPGSFGVVGVVWDPGAVQDGDVVQVRVLRGGTWGAWQDMEWDPDHGPDTTGPGAGEARGARLGTAPHVVQGDATQVRVLSRRPQVPSGIEATIVDPGRSEADATVGAATPGAATAGAARPTILTRRDWGADESMRGDGPFYGQAHIAFVHHTVDTNGYTSAQVPAIIRGIYDYHVNGQGWSDIGYNFLVDRFGRTWEGRHGGVDKAVIGAQTMNLNSWSFGVAAIGTYSSTSPPAAMVSAIERVIAWKFTLHGNPATGTVEANGSTFNRISGHRDGFQTSCPGQPLYDRLPSIRRNVAALMGSMRQSALRRSVDPGGTPDLLTYTGTQRPAALAGELRTLRGASPQPVRQGRVIGSGWNALAAITLTPDLTGDDRADIVARDPARNALRVYRGDGRGGFAGVAVAGSGWNSMTRLVAAGDRTGDGRNDLLAVRSDGALVLYRGDGRGWLSNGTVIGTGWDTLTSVVGAGDLTGDGHPDLLGIRRSDGHLLMYAGTAGGGVSAGRWWAGGWGVLNSLVSGPDLDGDGEPGDVLVRQADGAMRTYYADGQGRPARYNFWGRGWNTLDNLGSGADWDGDGVPDVVARLPKDSTLLLYAGTGARDFAAPAVAAPADVAGLNLVRVIGDVDGDGRADAVGRSAAGELFALRGTSSGGFSRQGAVIGRGWQVFDLIEAAGDFSNDGVPDVLARTTDGQLRLYTLSRAFTFTWQVELGLGWQAMRSVTGAGSLNTDFNGDVVALRRSDGALLLYRGSGPGTLNDSVVALRGQTDLARVVGLGDMNGDNRNDVLAEDLGGAYWLYVGNGNGFSTHRQPVRVSIGADDVLG